MPIAKRIKNHDAILAHYPASILTVPRTGRGSGDAGHRAAAAGAQCAARSASGATVGALRASAANLHGIDRRARIGIPRYTVHRATVAGIVN